MTIAEKITRAKADYDAVYEAGKAAGGGGDNHYDTFWDAFQNKGTRTYYRYAFNFQGWNEINWKPKYDIIPTGEITSILNNTNINGDLVEICENAGIVFDVSNVTQFEYCFQSSKFTRIGVINASKATKFISVFNGATELVTVDEVNMGNKITTIATPFQNCHALKNIKFSGTIRKSIPFAQSPLSVDSMKSVISCLKNYAGTDEDGTYKVTFTEDCWAALEASGSAPDGGTWADYVQFTLGWSI